ncbi:putative transcriptional regulator [[Clostridium] sordellii]|nr:hypothetical protein [Paeniclostridium sordellii]CEK29389.1 putative transcriptional regulator [[Clostridium] sordellii] [Paeniclostridium sordellii]CEQ09716.1 putative transcriptional regulator [[Clostridium] sordellii] [Paeniclostridium sordellii]
MTIEEQLKQLILSKYKSLRAFTQEIDVPYSTVDTMLKRGIGGTSVTTVLKVCNSLGIDADALTDDKIQEKDTDVNLSISSHELDILKKYNSLDNYGKDLVNTILDKECTRVSEIKSNK